MHGSAPRAETIEPRIEGARRDAHPRSALAAPPLRAARPSQIAPRRVPRRSAQGGARFIEAPLAIGAWGRLLVILGVVAVVAIGCAERHACYAGDFEACTCDDGRRGYAACDVEKDVYGACGSCGEVPGLTSDGSGAASSGGGGAGGASGGSGGASATTSSAKLGFMETCAKDEDCESGLCHVFNAKGPKCTVLCTTDADCPPPSPGCNNMGVCKAP